MGQLAFLYFLQKKGWLGVRIVPKEIVKEDLTLVYNSVDKVKKDMLEKVYTKIDESTYVLNIELISSKDFTDHEAELLSDIFINNDKFDKPWGSGSRQFMRKILWEHCERNNRNFFNDYLEPFFYDALNKKRKNHYFKSFNSKIPFLNGGLFEPMEGYHWKDVNFEIPNYIFSNKKEKDRKADGILDIFDRFNFTINEAEPLEKDIAVDPEMLGKIFEELLEVSDRKSKGAFYTPREIVHYMCQESLINHLVNEVGVPYEDMKEFILYGELIRDADNRRNVGYGKEFTIKESILNNISEIDDALRDVRVADPAVGSGAFPLGMLNEIVRARNNITEYIIRKDKEGAFGERFGEEFIRNRRSSYKMKLDTIKDSIFAVDIEPSAIDITKLRLWLSIVVDQEIDGNNKDPNPLPNLDMNIQVGNSLIDEYEGIKLFDKSILENKKKDEKKKNQKTEQMRWLLDSEEILNEMLEKQSQYFAGGSEYNKQYLKSRIDELRDQLIIQSLREVGNSQAIEKYKEIKKEKTKPYFIWELEFAKVFKENDGFDIVIGNPPYVDNETMNKKEKDIYKKKYISTVGHYDIYVIFYEKGIQLLKNNGILSYITSNKWMAQKYGYGLRRILLSNKVIKLLDFNKEKQFESATVDTQVTFMKKTENLGKYKSHKDLPIREYNFEGYYHRAQEKLNFTNVKFNQINTEILKINDDLNFKLELTELDIEIINKIKSNTLSFNNICYVTLGAVIHCKESLNTKDEFLYTNFKDGYKAYYEGKDVDKWVMKKSKKYLEYKPNLHREPRFKELFENEKIVSIRMSSEQNPHRFALDTGGYMADSTIVSINYNEIKDVEHRNVKKEIKDIDLKMIDKFDNRFLLAVLNSKLMHWYFFRFFSDGLHFYPSHLKQMPIYNASHEQQKIIIEIVDEIMKVLSDESILDMNRKMKKITELEENLNREIYALYEIDDLEKEQIERYLI